MEFTRICRDDSRHQAGCWKAVEQKAAGEIRLVSACRQRGMERSEKLGITYHKAIAG